MRENIYYIDVSRFDEDRNKKRLETLRTKLKLTDVVEDADYILAIGGDGTLLSSIFKYKHLNKPFLGVNGGTVGYYMQNIVSKEGVISESNLNKLRFSNNYKTAMPLLKIKATDINDTVYENEAFGDAWIERREAQCLKYNICVETETVPMFCSQNNFITGDGILFSTAAGSTGYSRSLSGIIMPIGTSNILVSPMHSTVDKRKLNGFLINSKSVVKIDVYDTDFRIPRLNIDGKTIKTDEGCDFIPKELEISTSEKNIQLTFIDENYLEIKSFDYLLN